MTLTTHGLSDQQHNESDNLWAVFRFVCLSACLTVCLTDCLHACVSACLPAYLSVCLPVFEIWANKLKISDHQPHTHTLQAVPHSLRHSDDSSNTHMRVRVVSGYISVRSRMSRMKHFTGGPEHCSWGARFVVLSSMRPRVCQGCQQSELMLSYWWMIISTNDFTSKAHRRNSDAIFEYYYHLPLTTIRILRPFSQCYHGKRC